MAIKSIKDLRKRRPEIDLTGPDGNAYVLMGIAKKLCDQIDRKFEPIRKEMMSGDYENLLKVFEREFGDYVDLYR